uniref:SJCHGC04485 protein n=1 Tax=Schistosoma japonicum TaxID=6182 RepID=Q5DEY6_SCHJA|nr:SJCHGC04485 protein [Schistosoma japonicum]
MDQTIMKKMTMNITIGNQKKIERGKKSIQGMTTMMRRRDIMGNMSRIENGKKIIPGRNMVINILKRSIMAMMKTMDINLKNVKNKTHGNHYSDIIIHNKFTTEMAFIEMLTDCFFSYI